MGQIHVDHGREPRILYGPFAEYHLPGRPAQFTITLSRQELGLLYSVVKFIARRYLPKMGGYGSSTIFGFARRLDRALGQAIDRHDTCKGV